MNAKRRISSFSLLYGMFVVIVLNPATVSTSLCTSRCKNAVPYLRKLMEFWHSISKRAGGEDVTFLRFILSLVNAAEKQGSLLKQGLVEMLMEYRDCVKACEHQHSKRSGITTVKKINTICFSPFDCLFRQ